MADKYLIDGLKDAAKCRYEEEAHTLLADPNEIVPFLQSIPLVYTSTPEPSRALRDAALKVMRGKVAMLLVNDTVKQAYDKVVDDVPALAKDLLWACMSSKAVQTSCTTCGPGTEVRYLCMRCDDEWVI